MLLTPRRLLILAVLLACPSTVMLAAEGVPAAPTADPFNPIFLTAAAALVSACAAGVVSIVNAVKGVETLKRENEDYRSKDLAKDAKIERLETRNEKLYEMLIASSHAGSTATGLTRAEPLANPDEAKP